MLLRTILGKQTNFFRLAFSMANKNKKDLYQTLGVSKSATQSQVKKAYYKLAQELHPDKNPNANAKDKFAEINNAYEILSDESKRKNYDRTGSAQENPYAGFENEDIFSQFKNSGFHGGGKRGQQNMHDFQSIFEDLFGGGMGGGKRGRGRNSHSAPDMSEDIELKIDLEFAESVNGTSKKIEIKRRCNCNTCKGTGAKPGSKPQKCHTCHGTGFMTIQQGIMIMRAECMSCDGTGHTSNNPCGTCSGQGFQTSKTTEEIKFPKGIDHGATMKFKGKGHIKGDLIIKVGVKKHSLFKREGNDSLIQKEVNIIEAVLGAEINVQTIYGQTKKVKIPAGIQNGQKVKLAKEGFFKLNTNQKGNQIITIRVKIPTKISAEEKQLYQKLKGFAK